jgi:hypothetical protein
MKRYLTAVFFAVISLYAAAQPKTKIEPADKSFPDGYKKHFTLTKDQSLSQILTEEIKDKKGVVMWRTTYTKDLGGKWTVKRDFLDAKGKVLTTTTYYYDEEIKLLKREFQFETSASKETVQRDENGGFSSGTENLPPWTPEGTKKFEKAVQEEFKKFDEEIIPSLAMVEPATTPVNNCNYQFAVFAGPSFMSGKVGAKNESFLGGNVGFFYNLNKQCSLGVDAAMHSTKYGTETLTRTSVYALLDVNFLNKKECRPPISPFGRIAIGMMYERLAKSKGNGVSFGGGGGVDFRIGTQVSSSWHIRSSIDYWATKFPNNDKLNGNFRASTGLLLEFGKK